MPDTEKQYSPDALARSARRLDLALAEWHGEVAERLGMGHSEALAMARLAMDDSQGPSDLARRLHLTTGAMTAVLDRLAERGHVAREPHAADHRKVSLRLTESARHAARSELGPMVDEIVALGERLSPRERAVAGRFLDELTTIVARAAGAR